MKRTICSIALASVSVFIAACGAPATNTTVANANTNTNMNSNTTKPAAGAPKVDDLLAIDKQANEAYLKGDSTFFDKFMSDKMVMYGNGERYTKAESVAMISKVKCNMKSFSLDEPQMSKIDDDTYALSYKGTYDGTCNDGPNGTDVKAPSPIRAATVYVRSGDKWLAAFHGENMIIDPKNPPKPEAKPAAPTAKKEAAKPDSKMASNSNANSSANTATAPGKPIADANTDSLVKLQTMGWEAFKAKDAKKFDEMTAANLSIVDPAGMWISGKTAVINRWTTEMKCEGVNSVKVSDGIASALSPTVEILTLKGQADGTCDGMKNGPIYQTAFYAKEGDSWKLAFMFESAAR
ncbi:MAG: nuclear transport factor 2 family protein [Acidobacteriota bacterium]